MKGLTFFLILVLSISVYAKDKTEAGLTGPGLSTKQVNRTPSNSGTAKTTLDLVIAINDQRKAPTLGSSGTPKSAPDHGFLSMEGAYTRKDAEAYKRKKKDKPVESKPAAQIPNAIE